jgi:hypothetical protein
VEVNAVRALWVVARFVVLGASAPPMPEPSEPPPSTVQLQFFRADDARSCFAESELRAVLTADLGYDPFAPASGGAPEVLQIHLARANGAYVADLELFNAQGDLAHQRLRSNDRSCTALGTAVEVAVSVMFDRVGTSPKAGPPEEDLLTLAPVPHITLPPEPPPRRIPPHFLAGALVLFVPNPTPHPAVQLAARWPSWSLELEAGREFYEDIGSGILARRTLLTLSPCFWTGSASGLGFCPVLTGGVREFSAANGATGSVAVLFTGIRLAVSAPLGGPFSLRLQAGAALPLLADSTTVNTVQVGELRSMALDFGAGLLVQVF